MTGTQRHVVKPQTVIVFFLCTITEICTLKQGNRTCGKNFACRFTALCSTACKLRLDKGQNRSSSRLLFAVTANIFWVNILNQARTVTFPSHHPEVSQTKKLSVHCYRIFTKHYGSAYPHSGTPGFTCRSRDWFSQLLFLWLSSSHLDKFLDSNYRGCQSRL